MQVFRDSASLRAAPGQVPTLSDRLAWLVAEVSDGSEGELDRVLTIVVVDPQDDIAAVAETVGFDPREEGVENLTVLPGWFELAYIVNGEGFRYVVYVPDEASTSEDLIAICRANLPTRPRRP